MAAIAPDIAAELFDTGVNMGPVVAAGFLQRALNALNRGASDYADVVVDGRIGPATLMALEGFLARRGAAGEAVLLRAIEALQGERYLALAEARPANEAFLYGWLANRTGYVSAPDWVSCCSPANAGDQGRERFGWWSWVPAFAGTRDADATIISISRGRKTWRCSMH